MPSEPQCPLHVPERPASVAQPPAPMSRGQLGQVREGQHGGRLGAWIPGWTGWKPISDTYCDPEQVTSLLWASLLFCAKWEIPERINEK